MNILRLATTPNRDPRVFDVYWMTGLRTKGRVRVHITARRLDDGRSASELATAQYLLVEKHVCGHDKAGAGLQIYFSCHSASELVDGVSPKSYLGFYANFLRTRFLGAEIYREYPPYTWADESCESHFDEIKLSSAPMTVIDVNGLGPVELTVHAVHQYIERFKQAPTKAWRHLKMAASRALPGHHARRYYLHDIKHRRQGHFYVDPLQGIVMVIADPERMGGLPRLVTVTRHDREMMKVDLPQIMADGGAMAKAPQSASSSAP